MKLHKFRNSIELKSIGRGVTTVRSTVVTSKTVGECVCWSV
jgi:hypothetical protein